MGELLAFLAGCAFVVLLLIADDWRVRRRDRKALKRDMGGKR